MMNPISNAIVATISMLHWTHVEKFLQSPLRAPPQLRANRCCSIDYWGGVLWFSVWFSNVSVYKNHLGSSLHMQVLGPQPQQSE